MFGLYVLLVLFGFLPFGVICYKMNRVKRLKKYGVRTMATVKELQGLSYRTVNSVVIEYVVGKTGEIISKRILTGGMPYRPGDRLPIVYDPNNPRYMQVDAGKSFVFLLVFTFLLAALFIAACFWIQTQV